MNPPTDRGRALRALRGVSGFALAGLAAAAVAGGAPGGPAPDPEAYSPPGRLVGVGPHRLHLHCTGAGSPSVVFESGLGGTHLDWTRVQPEVSRFARACSYDRAGYGWSEPGPEPRDAGRIAAELDRLLAHAGVLPPYVLVGHSFGGFVIRMFAARRERRAVAGLVLVDAAHEHQFERLESAGVRVPMAPTGRRFFIANHALVPSALPDELKPVARRLAIARKAIRTLYGELGSMRYSAGQLDSAHGTIAAPVVVLSRSPRRDADARHDRVDATWLDLQRDLARRIGNSSFEVVPGTGHYIHLDRPDRIIQIIRTIIRTYRVERTHAADRR